MKLATSLIYSLALAPAVFAQCENLDRRGGAQVIWGDFSRKFVPAPLPRGISLCYGRNYFAELKNGAGMQSALDRRRKRIILRRNSEALFRHELAHLYLDVTWKVLPYSASEPLAQALAFSGACILQKNRTLGDDTLRHRWLIRASLAPCEAQQLFADILSAAPGVREALPLR